MVGGGDDRKDRELRVEILRLLTGVWGAYTEHAEGANALAFAFAHAGGNKAHTYKPVG
jgi:hypothetical protein